MTSNPADVEKPTVRYDRQVRLWGTGTQQRLQETRIHVAGLNGLTCELAKTLTLAGVRDVLLEDAPYGSGDGRSGVCSAYDFATNHFVHQCDVDMARCRQDVVVQRIQELNPLVCVHGAPTASVTQSEEGRSPFVLHSKETPSFFVADVSTLPQLFALAAAADAAVRDASAACGGATLVVTSYCAFATLGVFLTAGTAEREARALFDASSLAVLPRPFQLCALRLLMAPHCCSDSSSTVTFAECLSAVWATTEAYQLNELTEADVQLFLNHARGQYGHRPLHESSSGIEFTIGGAFFAQQCISRVAPVAVPTGRTTGTPNEEVEDAPLVEATAAVQPAAASVYQWYATASPIGGDCECFAG